MSKLLKILLVILTILFIAFVGYMMTREGGEETAAPAMVIDSDVRLRTEKILADTQQIDKYVLDTSLFTDPRFRALKDYGVEVQDVATGRSNPFQPIVSF